VENWPALPLDEWRDTLETLHLWMQVVGKIRLALTPLVNHWWNVPLYVSARGLITTAIPYGERWFDLEFDFVDHVLRIRTNAGEERTVALAPRSVADFYADTMATLAALDIHPKIWTTPVELRNGEPIPFERDEVHGSYDREYVQRFWRIVSRSSAVLTGFRGRFVGKCSPVHFFWGSFDLAVTRFSGRAVPESGITDRIEREAYSHEVSSVGWWPGDVRLPAPNFYSYAFPEPPGFRDARVKPDAAYYHQTLAGFYLPYDAMRREANPEEALLAFAQSTYEAAADPGKWDRAALERS
jgi:hypothetical protein